MKVGLVRACFCKDKDRDGRTAHVLAQLELYDERAELIARGGDNKLYSRDWLKTRVPPGETLIGLRIAHHPDGDHVSGLGIITIKDS